MEHSRKLIVYNSYYFFISKGCLNNIKRNNKIDKSIYVLSNSYYSKCTILLHTSYLIMSNDQGYEKCRCFYVIYNVLKK